MTKREKRTKEQILDDLRAREYRITRAIAIEKSGYVRSLIAVEENLVRALQHGGPFDDMEKLQAWRGEVALMLDVAIDIAYRAKGADA